MKRRLILSGLVLPFLLPCVSVPASAALFEERVDTVVPEAPMFLTAGDLDGDGDLDLVVTHYFSAAVTVLLNDGTGRFAPAPGSPITEVDFPTSAAIGSFNPLQDEIPDLVVSAGSGVGSGILLYGDGTGRLVPEVSFNLEGISGLINRQVVATDFNGDGRDDAAFTSGQVRLGSGAGLVRWTPLPLIAIPSAVAAGDFDGDGHSDLAFTSTPIVPRLQTFLAVGDSGEFVEAPGSPLEFGVRPESMAAADFDQDGDLDLAVTDFLANGAHLLLNQGGGRLVPSGFVRVRAISPRGFATADFDGDGRADLAVGSNASSAISLLLGDGDGQLHEIDESPHIAGGGVLSLVAGDLNGDGQADLAAVDLQADCVAVFLHTPGPVRNVDIDILPGSDDNVIRLGSNGVLPVAILGTEEFDPTMVNPATVRLAGAPVHLDPSGSYACQPEDVNRDGRTDLLCKVGRQRLGLRVGDTVAVLLALTFDGQALRGQDAVRVLERKEPQLPATTRWPGAVIPVP